MQKFAFHLQLTLENRELGGGRRFIDHRPIVDRDPRLQMAMSMNAERNLFPRRSRSSLP